MRRAARVCVLVGLLLGSPTPAAAEIYRWIDEQGTAHYTEGLDRVPERHRARAVPLGLRNQPARPPVEAVSRSGDGSSPGGAIIRFPPGERILVDVRLNGRSSARLLLDTGADRTLINPRSLIAAGVSMTEPVARGESRGVTGSDTMLYFVLDALEVGEARAEKLVVAAYEMGWSGTDGLLGRDFLNRFNVSIDAGRGIVSLTPP
jgi:hypothetical protein